MKPFVLIAETDARLREVYRVFLANQCYDVETASDGLDCLVKLRGRSPAAVVLDPSLRWGGADGVLAWLREGRGTSRVPVILTGPAPARSKPAGNDLPSAVTYMPKPFCPTALLEGVRAAVTNHGPGAAPRQGPVDSYSEFVLD